jgi:predicted metal-dependent hydrolase
LYPQEYIDFLVHFHCDRDYFECHEILEEYWKKIDPGNKDSIWVGLIQIAVSCYHHRRHNFNGAKKTLEHSIRILTNYMDQTVKLGLNGELLVKMLNKRLEVILKGETYTSFNFPINDQSLIQQCHKFAKEEGFYWGSQSSTASEEIIHRHKLRDRTYVIEERIQALNARKGSDC